MPLPLPPAALKNCGLAVLKKKRAFTRARPLLYMPSDCKWQHAGGMRERQQARRHFYLERQREEKSAPSSRAKADDFMDGDLCEDGAREIALTGGYRSFCNLPHTHGEGGSAGSHRHTVVTWGRPSARAPPARRPPGIAVPPPGTGSSGRGRIPAAPARASRRPAPAR